MTNYNERLDEIFETLNNKAREVRASCTERNNWEGYNSAYERLESNAKQALTSLIKELVAEAKPPYYSVEEPGHNARHDGIEQYETNLKELLK